MKRTKIVNYLVALVMIIAASVTLVPAVSGHKVGAETSPGASNKQEYAILKPPAGENGISYLLRMAVRILTGLVAVLAVVSIVYAGVQYASAGDSPEKVKAAKDRIMQTVIGLLLYIFMFAILEFLIPGGVLGIRSSGSGTGETGGNSETTGSNNKPNNPSQTNENGTRPGVQP